MTEITIIVGAFGTIPPRLDKESGRLRNQRTSGDHPDNIVIKIRQNTEKSPADSRSLTVTQTLVKNHQLTLE